MDKIIEQDCIEYLKRIDITPLYGKTVLITGANGLIGTYLIYMLHLANLEYAAGINIVAISKNSPCKAINDIFANNYEFYSLNLNNFNFNDFTQKVDCIIHGATYAQPGKFLRSHLDTIHLNTSVTENLLKISKKYNAKFLFLSSSEIYGEPDEANIPTSENYPGLCSTVSIRSIYSESKRMGETLCYAYKNFEGVDAKVARIAMTYGPGVKLSDERVLAQFLKQALFEKRIVMLDDGRKVRTFCYIADCVLMIFNILLYGVDFVYNVGNKGGISIRNLAEEICTLTESTLEVCPTKNNIEQNIKVSPQRIELDTSKICAEFKLEPFKPFKQGLARTIEWNMEDLLKKNKFYIPKRHNT